jgi:hypothetical protein
MANILITRNLSPAPAGSSGARIMADATGKRYYVKFKENGQFLKVLANEYIAGKIAERLHLPCPSVHIVDIEPLLVPSLEPINLIAISEGPHFGSAELGNLYSLPPIRTTISKCANKADFPLIILFDALLYNSDRRNDGNFLITTSNEGYRFNIIDHGLCFGHHWDSQSLSGIQGEWSDAYLPEMYASIATREDFQDALESIISLNDEFFIDLIYGLPTDWLSDSDEKNAMISFLIAQRDGIGAMLATNIHKFPNLIQP